MATLEQLKALQYGDHVKFFNYQGRVINLKINGQPKTWKRQPGRVQVPVKYGLYEYGYLTEKDCGNVTIGGE